MAGYKFDPDIATPTRNTFIAGWATGCLTSALMTAAVLYWPF